MVIYLLVDQWMIYQSPLIKKNTTVSTDPDKRSHIMMNLDVTFPNAPCYMIDMMMKTTVAEQDKNEMIKSLHWRHENIANGLGEDSFNQILPFPKVNTSDAETANHIKKHLEDGNKCRVHGTLDVTKVTGQMAFRLRGETEAWRAFNEKNKNELGGKLKL